MKARKQAAMTLTELIVVLLIIAISGALALPAVRSGVENRHAKAALETLVSIANAVRLFEINNEALPEPDLLGWRDRLNPQHLLHSRGYLNPRQYANLAFTAYYLEAVSDGDYTAAAYLYGGNNPKPGRRQIYLRARFDAADGSRSYEVEDSGGFLRSTL